MLVIAQKMNPAVAIHFAGEIFGQSAGLVRSGAASTERRPVAGSYDKFAKLAEISPGLERFDPGSTPR